MLGNQHVNLHKLLATTSILHRKAITNTLPFEGRFHSSAVLSSAGTGQSMRCSLGLRDICHKYLIFKMPRAPILYTGLPPPSPAAAAEATE